MSYADKYRLNFFLEIVSAPLLHVRDVEVHVRQVASVLGHSREELRPAQARGVRFGRGNLPSGMSRRLCGRGACTAQAELANHGAPGKGRWLRHEGTRRIDSLLHSSGLSALTVSLRPGVTPCGEVLREAVERFDAPHIPGLLLVRFVESDVPCRLDAVHGVAEVEGVSTLPADHVGETVLLHFVVAKLFIVAYNKERKQVLILGLMRGVRWAKGEVDVVGVEEGEHGLGQVRLTAVDAEDDPGFGAVFALSKLVYVLETLHKIFREDCPFFIAAVV